MPAKTGQKVHHTGALVLGLAATALVVLLHLAGMDQQMELFALDQRLRNVAPATVNKDIVHIDIDDRSLEEFGRWPWDRELHAGLVDMLEQCGARAVVLDIIMPEPQETRHVSAVTSVTKLDFTEFLGEGRFNTVFDDAIFAATLRRYPNVCLPMHIDLDMVDPNHLPKLEAKAVGLLTTRPATPVAQAAGELKVTPQELAEPFRSALKRVLDSKVDAIVSHQSDIDLLTTMKRILPNLPVEEARLEADVIRRAYLTSRALNELQRLSMPLSVLKGYPVHTGKITPPVVTFVEALRHTGFVTFKPELDGVVRRIPLLVRNHQRVYPQLSLSVALQEFTRAAGAEPVITAEAGTVRIRFADGTARDIPVDANGTMLIRWTPRDAEELARHIPATAILNAWKKQQAMKDHKSLYRLACLQLAQKLGQREILDLARKADELDAQVIQAEAKWQRDAKISPATATQPSPALRQEEEAIDAQMEAKLKEFMEKENLDFYKQSTRDANELAKIVQLEKIAHKAFAANEVAKEALADLQAGVRNHVEGKICLIGSSATGAADFVPTPIRPREPGVIVHANILNTILSGNFIHEAHKGVNLLAIVLAGIAVTLLATHYSVLQAAPITLLLVAAFAAFNALVVFGLWNCWMVMVAPLLAMALSFLMVTAYRQLTEERAKRHIKAMFAHTLSPALVERVLEDPSLLRLGGEKRVLTCFFSDLAGFTPMSKQLGEQKTVQLLNNYFDRMMEVLQNRHGGYLSKFLGDGIFVFFGAPVFMDDHPARALHAALECQKEVAILNDLLAKDLATPIHLGCRIGIATGDAMVGNCGSTEKIDYTAIGDTVNLASRLEGANKFFGTLIMAADETWKRRNDDNLLARSLGRIYVVGRNEALEVWHVAGTTADTPDPQKQLLRDFTEGIERYRRREFAPARELFARYQAAWPKDKAAIFYCQLCDQLLNSPPPDNWDDAIKLTEK